MADYRQGIRLFGWWRQPKSQRRLDFLGFMTSPVWMITTARGYANDVPSAAARRRRRVPVLVKRPPDVAKGRKSSGSSHDTPEPSLRIGKDGKAREERDDDPWWVRDEPPPDDAAPPVR